ncbi:HAT family dimerization domain-containing protein [Trifolium pratense]|uniref:HAT family dimerization domain-containing protein n=1 Tax=Trifolium pratense TaxID=57577 RepID=A0A2K3KEM1_TRIPR|nr:HAT family dimerization domain-containing protein [Trifolium pratense]
MPPPHTGSALSKKILEFISDWGIEKKIFSLTLDNASANDEGLKIVGDALEKIRESVKYVKGTEGRMDKFKESVGKVGGVNTSAGLSSDVPTRWNSTYLMLESALKYQRVFSSLSFHDNNFKERFLTQG